MFLITEDALLTDEVMARFAVELVDFPIVNARYIATFHPESRYAGKVIFWDKRSDRTAEAQWCVCRDEDGVSGILSYRGFLLYNESRDQFQTAISRTLLVF